MTDKELVQAFRCCGDKNCANCPAYKKPECHLSVTYEGAAVLLEALIAENEHLREATKMMPHTESATAYWDELQHGTFSTEPPSTEGVE